MATNKPRFSVTFTDESFEKIQKYQRQNNITTQSKAVAKLVEMAISDIESRSDAEASIGEKAHIKKYRLLDPYGKEAVDSILDIEHKRCTEAARAALTKLYTAARDGSRMEVDGDFTLPEESAEIPE